MLFLCIYAILSTKTANLRHEIHASCIYNVSSHVGAPQKGRTLPVTWNKLPTVLALGGGVLRRAGDNKGSQDWRLTLAPV